MPYSNKSLAEYSKLSQKDCLDELKTSADKGLSTKETESRISQFGHNKISGKKKLNIILEFLSHFKSPLIIILILASIVSAVFGEVADAIIIGVMIFLSVALDFFLEHDAQKAAEKLKEMVQTKTEVLRDGAKKEIVYTDLCEGDIIFLSAGDMIPADCRIISAKHFFINQSSLTGESFPCEKNEDAVKGKNLAMTDMTNIAFMGTSVISGSATAIVIKTGKSTEFGKIAVRLESAPIETEFDKGVTKFGYLVTKAIIFLVLFIFLFNSIIRHNVLQSFLFALAVAVGLTPELLPMIISINMARGSMKMAKKGVIVKRLESIPNFGSMDVLCTDKTGTLTEDKIKMVEYVGVSGKHSNEVLLNAYLNSSLQTGIKNPLDNALMDFRKVDTKGYKKIDEMPFDFVRKKMSVVVEKNGKRYMITKGAPEEIFKCSSSYGCDGKSARLDSRSIAKVKKQYDDLSSKGYRVLAVAVKDVKKGKKYSDKDEKDMKLLGFVAFFDPPKKGTKEVIKELNRIGVEVKIITGDNEIVTKKICKDLGIKYKGVLLGSEVNELSDESLKVKVEETTIFARFSPDQKNRVIMAIKSNNHVVGYMGDGVNDSPSLRTADIGISVDSAVDIAKESADIILTRKSLRVLKDGILEGRKTFANTMKYIMMNLSSNFGNMLSVAGAILFLPFLPMLPIQILLNNFIYDFSQITIPGDNVDEDMIKKPKRWNIKFIKNFMIYFGPASSLFDFLTFFIALFVFHFAAPQFQTMWFIESLTTQTLIIHFIRTRKIPFLQSTASKFLFLSSFVCVGIGWILPFTPIGKFFGLVVLPWYALLAIVGIALLYFVMVQIIKWMFYKHHEF